MRLRIDLAYDGSEFHGWARQPGLRTVQGVLEEALDRVLRCEGSELTVAGRTDAGVHARGQVAHLDVAEEHLSAAQGRSTLPATDTLTRRLNAVVADDLRVHRISEAPPGFDARFAAVWRRYVYRIVDDPGSVDPLRRGHVVTWRRPLDLNAMNEAAQALLGEQDFAAFCKKRQGATTIRTLLELGFERSAEDRVITATVRADAFCHHLVRCLVGCLSVIGEGRRDSDWAAGVLAAAQRDPAVSMAPAHGLTLEEVGYPADALLAGRALRARATRQA